MSWLRVPGLILAGLLTAVIALGLGYLAYASWAWRDLPAATVEARFGGPDLRNATVDGVTIRFRWHPSAAIDAPVVVLIHSHFLDMGMWDAWVESLQPHLSVLRYDLAGHGLTGPDPSGIYTVARDVELLAGLLDRLGLEQVSVVGSSLGGNIAFTFAARHPQRTQALVLVNSGGMKRDSSRSGREMPGWADWVLPRVPPVALHRFIEWMIADDSAATPALKDRFFTMLRREGNRGAELSRLRQYDVGEPMPVLAAVTAPTLIQWGEANPQLPVTLAARFRAALTSAPSVSTATYPGAGHVLPLERPAASAADALDFLRDHNRNPTP